MSQGIQLLRLLSQATDRAVAVALLLLVSVAASIALSPGLFAQRIPYDDAHLGSVVTATLKASRDYDIPDEETTRRKREEAVAAVRAVYEYDAGALEGALVRVRSGFLLGRSQLSAAPEGTDPLVAVAPLRADIERALGARLEDAEFEALARAGYAESAQEAVEALVTDAMREMVVGDREELAQHRERGIAIVRRSAGGRTVEETLSDVSGIRDLARVRAAIDEDAPEVAAIAPPLRPALVNLARREVRVNLEHDPDLTRTRREQAAGAVKPVVIQLKKGEKVIGDGERIEERHLVIFRGMQAQSENTGVAQVRLGGALFAALVLAVLFGFLASSGTGRRVDPPRRKDLALLAALLVVGLFLADVWIALADAVRERAPEIPLEAWTYAIPFAAFPMLARFVLRPELTLVFAAAFAALVGMLGGNSLPVAAFALLGGLAGAARVDKARDRAGVFRAGLLAGLAQAAAVVCFALFGGKIGSWELLIDALAALLGGAFFAPMLVMALLPLVESVFRYTTDIRLLELANLNHPALKELIVQAPGTYHHSIIVGTLVEGAAEAIGANPLLAKVCAYYHDLGKGRNPLYFGENQKAGNRHDELPPEESARVIVEHVPLGMEIARKYKLPQQVAAGIPEHHGTRLVGYFFHKALKAAEASGGPRPDPARFRYAGPKPQSRETALIMMADAVEAASRAMADPTPEKLQALVKKLIDGIAADGQFDECDLTLRDLALVAQSFCRTLGGIYHSRPEYPAAAKGSQAALEAAGAAPGKVAR